MTNPRILFITCMPLEKPRTASMVVMSVLLDRYPDDFVWFALRPQDTDTDNPFNIPYGNAKRLDRLSRFPRLKQYLKLGPWARYQGHQAAAFGRSQNIEVVLVDLAFEAVIAGRVAAEILDVPLLVSVHDDPLNRIAVKGFPAWLLRLFKANFEKTMKAARGCGVISPYMGEVYEEQYGVETTTLFPGVKADECLPVKNMASDKKSFFIGSVGSVNSEENWNLLIEAVRILNQRYDAGKFRILHIGSLPEKLQKSSEVEVTGWIPEEEFLLQLARIDVGYLNWSFDPIFEVTRRTSFPSKTQSYIQAQIPMFALGPADSTVVRFVEDYNCGTACVDYNEEILACRLQELLCNHANYQKASQGTQQLKRKFSRAKFFENFESFVQV